RIPLDKLHSVPRTLLYSLEGLQDLEIDWQKILKLQSKDGSFLSSLSSTACVYLKTKDRKSLQYLQNAMEDQNYAVPCHYPIDLFESLWVIDTIERLGIDVFFRDEIKAVLDYVYRYNALVLMILTKLFYLCLYQLLDKRRNRMGIYMLSQ
ncbi:hypothetical protein SELMODRAFT_86646, partial [Selaginella moellendorffii]